MEGLDYSSPMHVNKTSSEYKNAANVLLFLSSQGTFFSDTEDLDLAGVWIEV